MNRFQTQIVYGMLIIMTGGILAFLSFSVSRNLQYVLAGGMGVSALFAFIGAGKSRKMDMPYTYNALQGAGMLAFAAIVLFYTLELQWFIMLTMGFLFYFGVMELFIGFELLLYKIRVNYILILAMLLTGLFLTIGAVVVLSTSASEDSQSLLMAGILFIISGCTFILLSSMTRKISYRH
jgi:hypothetical protein